MLGDTRALRLSRNWATSVVDYRASPEIPQLPQQLRELSRLNVVDRAGRRALRQWVEDTGRAIDAA